MKALLQTKTDRIKKKDWINVFLLVFWMKQISQHQGRIGLPTKEDMRLKKSF